MGVTVSKYSKVHKSCFSANITDYKILKSQWLFLGYNEIINEIFEVRNKGNRLIS